MDVVSTSIYILLYVFLLIFIFSIGILSPYLTKKDIGGIILIGFIIGAVGGLFFISPAYDDLAEVMGTGYGVFSNEDELINVDISSNSEDNVTQVIQTAKSLDGVRNVTTANITVETGNFSNTWDEYVTVGIKHNMEHSDNVGNVLVDNANGIIYINLTNTTDPEAVQHDLSQFLSESYDLPTLSSIVRIQVHVSPQDVDKVKDELHAKEIPTTDVEGPIQDIVQSSKNNELSLGYIIIISGIIGMVFAILGIFVDNIYSTWKRMGNKRQKDQLSVKEIKAERKRAQKRQKKEAKRKQDSNPKKDNEKSSSFTSRFKKNKIEDNKRDEIQKLKEESKINDPSKESSEKALNHGKKSSKTTLDDFNE